jgi:cellulose synthase/poly-beta-1,6-N-acetylglucosamine synthase-like glycosyltransferase
VRLVPTLRLGESLAAKDPPHGRVCVIVPAYNEARVSPGLVESCARRRIPELRVGIVLIVAPTETRRLRRAAIGGDDRFEVIDVDACPPDWGGQGPRRCTAGVTRSRGAGDADYLLFADCRHAVLAGVASRRRSR